MLLGQPVNITGYRDTTYNQNPGLGSYRVPNLQLDLFALDVDHPRTKLNPNSQVMHLAT